MPVFSLEVGRAKNSCRGVVLFSSWILSLFPWVEGKVRPQSVFVSPRPLSNSIGAEAGSAFAAALMAYRTLMLLVFGSMSIADRRGPGTVAFVRPWFWYC